MSDPNDLHKQPLITDDGELRIASPVANASVAPFEKPKKAKTSDQRGPIITSLTFWAISFSYIGMLYTLSFIAVLAASNYLVFPISLISGLISAGRIWKRNRYGAYALIAGVFISVAVPMVVLVVMLMFLPTIAIFPGRLGD